MKINKTMLKKFKTAINAWKKEGMEDADPEIKHCYEQDRKDLMNIYKACEKSNLKKAAILANNLDTIVRDQIPKSVYDILYDYY